LALVLAVTSVLAACGSSSGAPRFNIGDDDASTGGSGDDGGPGGGIPFDATTGPGITPPGPDGSLMGDAQGDLAISPTTVTLAVTLGTTPTIPTQQFTTTFQGAPVSSQFTVDRGEIGAITVAGGLFTPGSLGGTATVTATYQGHTATASVTVKITYISVGDPNPPDAGAEAGAGGYGGVGGVGEGQPATSGQIATLNGTPTADGALAFLYPYDATVFPQAILPPLLQWTVGTHSFDAVRIHISENNYDYKGYFQKPGTPFQNHPVPQAVWNALAYSNGGEAVNVELVFAEGTNAVGPVKETWKFAQGELKGTIYYNSYGTNLATNHCCTYSGASFGGATLAIKEGALEPVLIAGSNGNDSNCRVCHSVSANGATLITQHGDNGYAASSTYALTAANAETTVANHNTNGNFTYPAMFPDGTMMFSHESPSVLYDMTGTAIPGVTGLPSGLSAFTPAFSPDGNHVAFNFAGGTGSDGASIASIDFAPATKVFSNLQTLVTPTSGTHAYWPSFLPTNTGVVYEVETVYNGRDTAGTRSQCDTKGPVACQNEGTHAELWWVDVATKQATRLDTLNGKGYLPPHSSYTGSNGDDSTLNYEPTVNPVPSGGYAWVVFTSRRLYGNVATINPFWSDPRFQDISVNPTTKKLWVAAIDLNAKPGTDPSHPAFYLPAQELMAGNARGFWVVDPCQKDGTSCQTGDECCGGYCRPGPDGGGLTCTATQPSCSQEFEKCTTTADCCGAAAGIVCIDGRCGQSAPK
jgi:hypothetical protein